MKSADPFGRLQCVFWKSTAGALNLRTNSSYNVFLRGAFGVDFHGREPPNENQDLLSRVHFAQSEWAYIKMMEKAEVYRFLICSYLLQSVFFTFQILYLMGTKCLNP